ncbi:MAG: RidA family protein [Chloroflexi bacterium]|nr:RidA family protein [Chloroflexota bacterium]
MSKRIVQTDRAPAAIGPYSQGVVANGWLFISGQLGLDPQTGQLVPGGVQAETEQALRNLRAVLQAAGGELTNVVKVTVYLRDMADFAAMNEVYARFFTEAPPARAAIQAAALPKGAAVEIEAIAYLGAEGE